MAVPPKVLTLVLIRDLTKRRILLGMKKRGFGKGRWNGFGGKVEVGETICDGARREVLEECCLKLNEITKVGRLDFEFIGDPQILKVHVFQATEYHGNAEETEEMRPRWFHENEIPFSNMWPDDVMWFPLMLSGKKFYGYFKFKGHDDIVEHTISEVENLDDV
ncbi:oxidized purine nucleoside triphosphate hydrolase-like [Antedon mediterranea]|uniref:oxidized purine nucleoside triphosphate hydrolase-like n=1 Tax=Antedon mediterranea TaxID=105859 RepID=UPI003AF63955